MILELHTPTGIWHIDTDDYTHSQLVNMGLEHQSYRAQLNDKHLAAIASYKNWDSLTLAQKDTILKNLLFSILFTEGYI